MAVTTSLETLIQFAKDPKHLLENDDVPAYCRAVGLDDL